MKHLSTKLSTRFTIAIPFALMLVLFTGTTHAQTVIDTVKDNVDALLERTSGLKARTENTLTEVQFVTDTFKNSLGVISAEVSDSVRYGYEDLNTILENNREGLADFLNVPSTSPTQNSPTSFNFEPPSDRSTECSASSPCGIFREDLKDFILQMETLSNTLIANNDSGVDLNIDFALLDKILEQLPSRALFPLYRVMVVETSILNDMQYVTLETTAHLDTLVGALDSRYLSFSSNQAFPQDVYDAQYCQPLIENFSAVNDSKKALAFYSAGYKVIGKFMIAMGDTMIKYPDLSGGFAEFANIHVSVKDNDMKKYGSVFDGISDALSDKSKTINQKISLCTSLRAQLNILDAISNINGGGSSNNQAVLDGQADILAQQQAMIQQQQEIIDRQLTMLSAINDIDQGDSDNQEVLDGQSEILENQETIIDAVSKNKPKKKTPWWKKKNVKWNK